MAQREYYVGSLVRQIDFFAFPRTGSHFLIYCCSGLFDLISILPAVHRLAPEAASRQDELRPEALYALSLREPGVPFQPVWLNTLAGGNPHGVPMKDEFPMLLLIRDPMAAVYSAWRARKRLGFPLNSAEEVQHHLEWCLHYYETGFSLLEKFPSESLLVRYEELVAAPSTLEKIIGFAGVTPKLQPDFVHRVTRFDSFVNPGDRSFYREGRDTAWKDDAEWLAILSGVREFDLSAFGYPQELSVAS